MVHLPGQVTTWQAGSFPLAPNRPTLNPQKCVTIERSGYTSRTGQARRRRLSIMLSESEQQRLADIEAALRNDTRFVNGFNRAIGDNTGQSLA